MAGGKEEATLYAFDADARRWRTLQVSVSTSDQASSSPAAQAAQTILNATIEPLPGDEDDWQGECWLIEQGQFNTNPSNLNALMKSRQRIEMHEKAIMYSMMFFQVSLARAFPCLVLAFA